jgi:polysaccharide biosynthesis/export protein
MLSVLLQALLLLPPLAADEAVARQSPPAEYRIGPEDVLNISVWQNPELTRTVPVRPDGRISLPLLNDVEAAGLTPSQLQQGLVNGWKEYVPNAVVSVVVSEVNAYKVSVMGKVLRPDRYKLRSPATVLDVLALAGGFQEWANPEEIVVLRQEVRPPAKAGETPAASVRRIRFNYKRVIAQGGELENFSVQPNDIVVVP